MLQFALFILKTKLNILSRYSEINIIFHDANTFIKIPN